MSFTLYEKDGLSWTESDILPVSHVFTRRLGDVGDYPYCSVYDPEWLRPERQEKVRTLWKKLARAGDFPEEGFCFTRQIHGTLIRYVTEEDRKMPPLPHPEPDCDGLITDRRNVPLCVFSADCTPVLFCEEEAGLICAVHSGWKGSVRDMMGSAVREMTARGADVKKIRAAMGPAAGKCCFECGPEVKEAVEALLGADAEGVCPPEEGVPGKFMVDVRETNRRRLLQLGLLPENIDVSPDCTMCQRDVYWSHRATGGVRGTMANIIILR